MGIKDQSAGTVTRSFTFPDPTTGPWTVDIHFGVLRGRAECVGIAIHAGPGGIEEALGTSTLRQLRLAALVDQARIDGGHDLAALVLPSTPGKLRFGYRLGELADVGLGPMGVGPKRPVGRPELPLELLKEAAQIYLTAPRAPTKAVAETMSVSYSTAARYVQRARAEGFIAETTRGRISGRQRR